MILNGGGINQIVLFTHNDLDGVGCAILAKKAYGQDAVVHMIMAYSASEYVKGWMENTYNSAIHQQIIIADLSVSSEVADLMEEMAPGRCHILDHHETAKRLNDRDWCYVVDDGAECGMTLLLKFLKQSCPSIVEYRLLADLVNCYDNQGTIPLTKEAYDMNLLLTIFGKKMFIDRFIEDSSPVLSEFEQTLLLLEYDRIKRFVFSKMIRAFTANVRIPKLGKEVKISFTYANNYINDVATALLNQFPDAPIACVVNLPSSLSFRMKSDADLSGLCASEIAECLGGGGHFTASGAPVSCQENIEGLKTLLSGKGVEITLADLPDEGIL